MKTKITICILFALTILFACKKDDYKNDGGKSIAYVDMTTYDYLKSNKKFDSLVKVIDKAGLKDAVNGNITFFATTNYGVADYVAAKKNKKAIEVGNENIKFTIQDLNVQQLRDSLKTYMFPGKINRDDITLGGVLYDSALGEIPNVKFMIKFRRSYSYNAYVSYIDYVNFTKVVGTRDDKEADQSTIPQNQKDKSVDCQTSGIITKTGILHVLDGNHRLFFNAESMGK
jgi:hypothetical protein